MFLGFTVRPVTPVVDYLCVICPTFVNVTMFFNRECGDANSWSFWRLFFCGSGELYYVTLNISSELNFPEKWF